MRALILASAEATGQDPDGPHKVDHRVIADHLRSTSFLIADGVLPSNEGRGYVLRRIMRRAMRHAHMMGAREPVMWRLVPALVRQMGAAYPELGRAEALIEETLRLEETRFAAMLERGLHLLAEETARLGERQPLPGAVAFRLYDTYGFPLDLTQDALREQGRGVDLAGFEAAMAEQRARARAAWAGSGEAATESVWFEIKERVGATEFLGYATEQAEGEIVALVANGEERRRGRCQAQRSRSCSTRPRSTARAAARSAIPASSPAPTGCASPSADTQKKLGDLFVHLGVVASGTARVGHAVLAEVDHARRGAIRAHHSATHLLHEALRRELGTHVAQKGSLNAPDRLRFDVSQPRPITADELARVEAEVNRRIRENTEVDDAADDPRGGGRDGRDGAVRGEIRRGGPRRLDGRGRRATSPPIRSSCAAARMSGGPATSAISRSSAEFRRQRRRAPDRGGGRRRRRGGGGRERARAGRSRRRAARQRRSMSLSASLR